MITRSQGNNSAQASAGRPMDFALFRPVLGRSSSPSTKPASPAGPTLGSLFGLNKPQGAGSINSRPVNSILPGGCDVVGSGRGCGSLGNSKVGALLKQVVDLVSSLLKRLKGNNDLGSNGNGLFDPREFEPCRTPAFGGSARPGTPTVGLPGIDDEGPGNGGGRKHPDCDLPKK